MFKDIFIKKCIEKYNRNHDPATGRFAPSNGVSARSFSEASSAIDYAKEHAENTYLKDITEEELDAIDAYVGDDYIFINGVLRGEMDREELYPEYEFEGDVDSYIKGLDSVIERSTLAEDVMLYRGVGLDAFNVSSKEQLKELVGKEVSEAGYSSTTLLQDKGEKHARNGVLIEIEAPKGTHGIFPQPRGTGLAKEAEFILPRGSKFKVESVDDVPEKNHIKVKLSLA